MTRDLLCPWRPPVPSQWGEDAGRPSPEDARCLPDWVLEAQADKWTQRAPVLQVVILKEEQREKRKKEWHGKTKPDEQGQ